MAADSRGRCRPAVLRGDCDVAIIMGGDLIELQSVDAGLGRRCWTWWLLCLVVEGGELRATEQGTAHCSRRAVVGVDGFVGGAERPVGVLADQDAVGSY
jgi:hypothetical protein